LPFVSTPFRAIGFALALAAVPATALAGPPVPQGGQVTSSVDVQLTVLPLCKSVSVSGNQIHFSATPSTQPATATFSVSYDCAANAFPTLAFLSQNGCKLLPDDRGNPNVVDYQILGAWGNQLACTPADLKNHFRPITTSPTTFTLKTAPLLQLDPHVVTAGTYGDTVIATLDF
jgi:spore coat protein U-like protein